MALLTWQWFSQSLGKCTKAQIYVNDRATPPYPTYYLLHGLSDDETKWLRGTTLEDHANPWPFLIVMPDGERSFYCDHAWGAFENLVARELVPHVDRLFPTRPDARFRAVGGLSMGGYGAMKFALKFPDTFRVGVSHSGALTFARQPQTPSDHDFHQRGEDFVSALGPAMRNPANDLFALAAKLKKTGRPALSIDCGVDDHLIEDNRSFHRHLETLKIPHAYSEHPGAHNWPYWNARLPEALAFAAKAMRLKPLSIGI